MFFVMKINWLIQSTLQNKNLKTRDVDVGKSHYVYIKNLDILMFYKTKGKIKNIFVKAVCSISVIKMYWLNIKKFVEK